MPKEDILAFTATQEYTHTLKFILLILLAIRQNGGIVLDMLEFCYFWYVFHKVVLRHVVGVVGHVTRISS